MGSNSVEIVFNKDVKFDETHIQKFNTQDGEGWVQEISQQDKDGVHVEVDDARVHEDEELQQYSQDDS